MKKFVKYLIVIVVNVLISKAFNTLQEKILKKTLEILKI